MEQRTEISERPKRRSRRRIPTHLSVGLGAFNIPNAEGGSGTLLMFIPLHQLNRCALAGRKALYPRRARQAIKAAIKITSRTNSDAGHMAASLTRTNRTSSQLPALWGSVLLFSAFFALFYPSALSCHIFFQSTIFAESFLWLIHSGCSFLLLHSHGAA